jgi:hypothetical protein
MKSRPDKNSTTAAVAGFQGSMGSVPLPEGITLRSDEEHVIWGQFTRARAREDWRDMDLLLLAKVVRLEVDIRQHQNEIDVSGTLVEDKRGREVLNPLLTVVDTLERRQMAVIRSMSLNQTASDPRTINGAAKTEGKASDDLRDMWASGLIAKPKAN